jgi:hypothetical protein
VNIKNPSNKTEAKEIMKIVPQSVVYARNAEFLIKYRTGKSPQTISDDQIVQRVREVGYLNLSVGYLLVCLIDASQGSMFKAREFERIVKDIRGIVTKNTTERITEVIFSGILTSSIQKIGSLRQVHSAIATKLSDLYTRIDMSGKLAFNCLNNDAFPVRESMFAHVSGQISRNIVIQTDLMTAKERDSYRPIMRSPADIAPIEDGDSFCLWNNYRIGDVFWFQSLSNMTIAPIMLRRVVVTLNLTEQVEKEPETELDTDSI